MQAAPEIIPWSNHKALIDAVIALVPLSQEAEIGYNVAKNGHIVRNLIY